MRGRVAERLLGTAAVASASHRARVDFSRSSTCRAVRFQAEAVAAGDPLHHGEQRGGRQPWRGERAADGTRSCGARPCRGGAPLTLTRAPLVLSLSLQEDDLRRMATDPASRLFTNLASVPVQEEELRLTFLYAGWAGQWRDFGVPPSVMRKLQSFFQMRPAVLHADEVRPNHADRAHAPR